MFTRRDFIKTAGAIAVVGSALNNEVLSNVSTGTNLNQQVVISTWRHGLAANKEAINQLFKGKSALDAVEHGVRVSEADPEVTSVGYGGLPDRDGKVTLDACIMDENGNCGSVSFVQGIKHPISLARLVMEKTQHVMLSGKGAELFAYENGFQKEELLTEQSRKKWKEWLNENQYKPIDINNHDTISMLALDKSGNLSGACTTSGLAWKMHGRVGDSPIIGAGLFVDNEVGAAGATGKGEAVIKIAGSFLVVELMRQGLSPMEACREAVMRIIKKQSDYADFQVAFIALNKHGETGYYAIQPGFEAAVGSLYQAGDYTNELLKSECYMK